MSLPEQPSVTRIVDRIVEQARGRLDFGLRPGVSRQELAEAESTIGFALPDDVRQFYLAHDGQDFAAPGLLFGYPVPPLAEAMSGWRVIDRLADDSPSAGGDSAVRQLVMHKRWFPVAFFQGADQLLVDTDPTDTGTVGQVIRGGYEVEDRRVLAVSLTALLQQVVAAFDAGEVLVDAPLSYSSWGLAPGGTAPWLAEHYFDQNHRSDQKPSWIGELDSAWRAWFDTKSDGFWQLFEQATTVSEIPAGATNLDPLAHVRALRTLDLHTYRLSSLEEVAASESLLTLRLGRAEALTGVERFPALTTLLIDNSPGIDLAPLEAAPQLHTVHIGAPAANHRALAATRVQGLQTTARTDGDLEDVLQLDTLTYLMLDAEGLDVAASPRWSQLPRLTGLALIGATVSDLRFLARLPRLINLELRNMHGFSFRGLADLRLRAITVTGVSDARDPDELNSLPPGTFVALPYDLWNAVKRDSSPFVWDYFTEVPRNAEDQLLLDELRAARMRRTDGSGSGRTG